jgi:ribonuclease P protein component
LSARAHGFGADARLTSRLEFQRVFQDGRKTPGRSFTVWSRRDARPGPARLGLSVAAKVGTAVRRARLKRLTRETFRLNRDRLAAGADVVVALRPGCSWRTRADAERELLDAWQRAGLLP